MSRRQKPSVILLDDSDGDDAPQAPSVVDLTDEPPWLSVAAAAGHGSVIGGQSPTARGRNNDSPDRQRRRISTMNEVQFISSSSNINTNNLARRYSSSTPSGGGLGQSLASFAGRGMSASSLLGMGGGRDVASSVRSSSTTATVPLSTNRGLDLDTLLEQHNRRRHSAGLLPTDFHRKRMHTRKSKHHHEPTKSGSGSLTAMTKGKIIQLPRGYDSIDMHYPQLKANDRTMILYNLAVSLSLHDDIATMNFTKKFVHDWRVKFDQANPRRTLWAMALAFSNEVTTRMKGYNPIKNMKKPDATGGKNAKEDPITSLSSIGPVSGDALNTLQTHFHAHLRHSEQKNSILSIQPLTHGPSSSSLSCSICADDFVTSNILACSGDAEVHFYCKPCLYSYCTVTVQSGPIQTMCCPLPNCKSLFATLDIQMILSDWDVLMISNREDSRDRHVAMAGKAILHCECGVVAIIAEQDMGNGRVICPGTNCGRRYCAKCGNVDHGTETCPPPAETIQWLSKHSKPCPNCNNPIEKNGGCDHMTCTPPFGCGHEFWYSCGCNYRGAHKCNLRQGIKGMF